MYQRTGCLGTHQLDESVKNKGSKLLSWKKIFEREAKMAGKKSGHLIRIFFFAMETYAEIKIEAP